jgi:CBS domain-containing protein
MNKVFDILKTKNYPIISVSPETSVLDALKMMADKNIGSVLVISGNEYLGIMSERDYSRKVILKGKNSTDTKVGEIMLVDLPRLCPEDGIDHCMKIMSDKNIRYLPVFEEETLIGVISMSDVVKATIDDQKDTINHLQNYIYSG